MDHFASTAQKGKNTAKNASGEVCRCCREATALFSEGAEPADEAALPFFAVVLLMLAGGGESQSTQG